MFDDARLAASVRRGHDAGLAVAVHAIGDRAIAQVLDAFGDEPMDPDHPKYVCAPCSNCKGQFRDLLQYYNALEKSGITYGGLVELIVNAMVDVKEPFIEWEMH